MWFIKKNRYSHSEDNKTAWETKIISVRKKEEEAEVTGRAI